MKGNFRKKAAALSLAALLVTGSVPVQPIADLAREFSLTASAATYAYNSSVNLTNCYVGDIFEAGATLTNNTNNVVEVNGLSDVDELAVKEPYQFTQRCQLTSKSSTSVTFTVLGIGTTQITSQPGLNTPILYDGTAKSIIRSAAAVSGGQTVYYGVSTSSSSQPSSWTANYSSITATNKGTYYIWLKTNGNASYNPLSATRINNTVTVTDDAAVLESHYFGNSNGSQSQPFLISDTADWNFLCEAMEHSDIFSNFSGKHFRLENDITVSRSAGLATNAFAGSLDGYGKTLTFNSSGSEDFIAPFAATASNITPYFRNLTVKGTINSTGSYAAGLIGHLYGNVTIENCKSNIDITSAGGSGGFVGLCEHTVNFKNCLSSTVIHSEGGNNSGFVGWSRASGYEINFTGCLFSGKLLQKNGSGASNGGFIGWTGSNKTVTITNSLCAPAALSGSETMASDNSATFARGWNNTTAASNSYYITAIGSAQAKAAHSITAGADTTVGFGTAANTYNVSGITAYGTGLSYGGKFYAGKDDSVALTLSHTAISAGYTFNGYTVNAGTLNGSTLTMPDSDVVVSSDITHDVYNITTNSISHGNVYIKVNGTAQSTAHYGDTITLTVAPNKGYEVKSVTVNGSAVTLSAAGEYSFTMPEGNVDINVIADTISYFDSTTGTLYLKGSDIRGIGSNIILPDGVSYTDVLHIAVDAAGAVLPEDSSNLFGIFTNVKTIDLTGADSSSVTNMGSMFYGCTALTTLTFGSGFDTSSVTNMDSMFQNCKALTSLDLSGFDTGSVTDMSYMFDGCKALTSLDLSGFDTGSVTDMSFMFSGCEALTTLTFGSGFDTGSVTDMRFMFSGCKALTTLTFGSGFDTSSVTNMDSMFQNCKALTSLDLSGFDTGSVTDMSYMFQNCKALTTLDLSGFDTGSVTDMSFMFRGCEALTTLTFGSGFDTSSATNMNYMFSNCEALTTLTFGSSFDTSSAKRMDFMFDDCKALTSLDLSGFKTSSVTNMRSMFYGCEALTTLTFGSSFDTSSVTNMYCMFSGCKALTSLDLSSFKTSSVTNMISMFSGCEALTTLTFGSGFDTSSVKRMDNMFSGCKALTSLDLSGFDTGSVTYMSYMFQNCKALTTLDLSSFETGSVTDMGAMFDGCEALTSLTFGSSFETGSVTNMTEMFSGCKALTSLDLSSFDTSSVKYMYYMFKADEKSGLTAIYVGRNWNTDNVEDSEGMFSGCTNLKGGKGTAFDSAHTDKEYARIDGGTDAPGYLSVFSITVNAPKHGKVTLNNTDAVFPGDDVTFTVTPDKDYFVKSVTVNGTELASADGVYSFEMPADNVTVNVIIDAESYFDSTTGTLYLKGTIVQDENKRMVLPDGVSYTDVLHIAVDAAGAVLPVNSSYLFYGLTNVTSIDLTGADASSVTDMSYMFSDCEALTTLTFGSGFDTSSVTDMDSMFQNCKALTSLDLSGFKTSSVTYMYSMFDGCEALTTLTFGSGFDTSSVTYMDSMFQNCKALTSLDLSGFDTGSVTDMSYMFYGCTALTTLTFGSGFDTSSVTNMKYMFFNCEALTTLTFGSGFDTSGVTDMSYMFSGCEALTTLTFGSSFDTSSVTNMDSMFDSCEALTTLDLSSFDTSSVKRMEFMFSGCKALTSLDLSSFKTGSVTYMCSMFDSCEALTTLTFGSGFDTGSVTNMSEMFSDCKALTSLTFGSAFDTSSVTDMHDMFFNCESLTTLDLSSFDTSSVKYMYGMFKADEKSGLTAIYVGRNWNTDNVEDSEGMFSGCTNLKGGKGTAFDSAHTDKEYARIDGGTDEPGYLSVFSITVNAPKHGKVTLNNTDAVFPGDDVTFTVTPDKDYFVKSVTVNGTELASADGVYSFEMPAANTVIAAEFTTAFAGRSITLGGDIGVVFYLDADIVPDGSVVSFTKETNGESIECPSVTVNESLKETVTVNNSERAYYKIKCSVNPAEMTSPITASVTAGEEQYTVTTSVRDFADAILGSDDYIDEHDLVTKMLDYGAKAQLKFGKNTDDLANAGIEYTTPQLGSEDIELWKDALDMESGLEEYGLAYEGTSLLYLNKTTMRHYYSITDESKNADDVIAEILHENDWWTAGKKGNYIYFDMPDYAPEDLCVSSEIKINGVSYVYSPFDYVRGVLEVYEQGKGFTENDADLARATYVYAKAAENYVFAGGI